MDANFDPDNPELSAPKVSKDQAPESPLSFTVTRDCRIDGVAYSRGDEFTAAKDTRKLNVLVSNRILLPTPDPHHRKTDGYGFGSAPRKHPTPTSYSPAEIKAWV